MMFQENVMSWFQKLSSYKRIDVMCTLLNMCLPFEVRYMGTYIEDLGKRDYNELRDTEHRANNTTELNDLSIVGLTDTTIRRKLILYMTLLNGSNYSCALIHYKSLSNYDAHEISNLLNEAAKYNQDQQLLEELLLLYTMALNHPAFTYEQKTSFGNIYQKLQEEEKTRLHLSKRVANSTEFCEPCAISSDQLVDEASNDCIMPVQSMQPYLGNSINSWPNQIKMANQMTRDLHTCLSSLQISNQESPLHSRSPSRSNSPLIRQKNNASLKQPFENRSVSANQTTVTTLATTSNNNNLVSSVNSLNECLSTQQQQQVISNKNISSQSKKNNCNAIPGGSNRTLNPSTVNKLLSNDQQQISIKTASAGSSKDKYTENIINPKGNIQNFSVKEFRKMSDEDLKELGLTPNVVGQLRNLIKSQTTNRLQRENKPDHSTNLVHNINIETSECERLPGLVNFTNDNWPTSTIYNAQQPMVNNNHAHINNIGTCYPTMPPSDATQIPIHVPPPNIMNTNRNPCYACLSKTVGGMNNHYPRYTGQHMYCLAQLQSLQLDPESGRHCSQSSSSDSSESRSPSETPPVAPWSNNIMVTTTNSSHISSHKNNLCDNSVSSMPVEYNVSTVIRASTQINSGQQNIQLNMQQNRERPKNTRKNLHMKRQKNHMMNGTFPHMSHCLPTFPIIGQRMGFRSPGQFPLRPNIYSTFPHTVPRLNYPANYQPNGEIMYPYPAQSPVTCIVSPTAQAYMPAPMTTFVQQSKISCHNCGSNTHLAIECKDQTVEDLTRKAQYSLDYTINQQGECSNNDK